MKKTKVAKKKSARPARSKKATAAKKSSSKAPVKMPVNTFDAWVTKQVKAGRKESPSESSSKPAEATALPKDTFDSWIDKQKPKEVSAPRSNSSVPDTYELWMAKQVAQKSSVEEKEQREEVAPEASPAPM